MRPDAVLRAAGLDPAYVARMARTALEEDLAGGIDVSTVATVASSLEGVGRFVARRPGVVAGVPVAVTVLQAAGRVSALEWLPDGSRVASGQTVLTVAGPTHALLTAERSALNLLGHLSGIATLTRRWVDAVAGTPARIRDTRKTTPGLRALEKYAVRCGGGLNHRFGLFDAALVKDNHVLAAGGVGAAYAAVRVRFPDLAVEVECDTLDQVAEALDAGAGLLLLDNMALPDLTAAARLAHARGALVEASGGLTLDNAADVAATGVDYLAVGALTHSAPALDIGLDM